MLINLILMIPDKCLEACLLESLDSVKLIMNTNHPWQGGRCGLSHIFIRKDLVGKQMVKLLYHSGLLTTEGYFSLALSI